MAVAGGAPRALSRLSRASRATTLFKLRRARLESRKRQKESESEKEEGEHARARTTQRHARGPRHVGMSALSAVVQPSVAALQNMEAEEEERVDITEEELVEDDPKARQEEVMLLDNVVATTKSAMKPEVQVTLDNDEVDAQLRAMAVSVETGTPNDKSSSSPARAHRDQQPPSAATSTGTRSAGESHDDLNNGKDRLKPFVRTCTKFESGSGSGDQEGMVTTEDGNDVAAKKRKTRRGKPKHRKLKPYSKQQPSYQQRLRTRALGRPTKTGRQPPAPYNTTQFLMDDHNDLPDLDEKIAGAATGAVASMAAEVHSHFSKPVAPPRTRDSSFSIDSDEDYFYSSPEDEEEFLQKEFSTAYEDLHAERLSALSKTQLIQEYIQLEARVDLLTKRLRSKNQQEKAAAAAAAVAAVAAAEADPRDPEAAKAKLYQQRVEELLLENEQLRRENELLRKQRRGGGSPMSSVDSESDSESSCSNQGSNCSCNEHKASPGSSPVPASYQAHRDKAASSRRKSSVSSVDSESDSTTGESSAGDASPKTASTTDVANGHATAHEIDGLPIT